MPIADLLGQRILGRTQRVRDQPLGKAERNDVGDLPADQLVATVAELALRLDVQQHDVAVLAHDHHRIGRRLQQPAIARLHLGQPGLGGLPDADVADRRGHQHAVAAFQRTQHDLDGKRAAVLAAAGAGKFDARADLLGQCLGGRAGAVGKQALGKALGDDVADRLAQQFVPMVAELALRLEVQQHDLAAPVHHHHRVGRRFHEGAIAAFHLQQLLFGGLARADVADRRRHQHALPAFERAEHDLDGKAAAVLAAAGQLDARTDLLRKRLGGPCGGHRRSAAPQSRRE